MLKYTALVVKESGKTALAHALDAIYTLCYITHERPCNVLSGATATPFPPEYGAVPQRLAAAPDFEERYKLMLEHCLDNDSKFGVVLIKAGSEVGEPAIPYSTGTVAHITQVNRMQEGRFFVAVVGQQRFHIENITQYRPYIAAQVRLLDEDGDAPLPDAEMDAVRESVTSYSRLAEGLRGGWVSQARMPSDPVALSYYMADLLQADLAEKQALLEQPSASRRLHAARRLMDATAEALKVRVARELRGKFSVQ